MNGIAPYSFLKLVANSSVLENAIQHIPVRIPIVIEKNNNFKLFFSKSHS
jgi:hypothetical protein